MLGSLFTVLTVGIILYTTFGSEPPAYATDLAAPFALENAQVLPSGVRNVRFFNLFMTMENRFSRTGPGLTPLGNSLNKDIRWRDVYKEQSDQVQRNMIKSVLSDNGIPEDGIAGSATGQVNTFVDVKVPIFAMAITPKFTLAVAVPIVKIDVSVDTGFVKSADGQAFVKAAGDQSPDKGNEAARKLNNATTNKLNRLGYQSLRSETISGIGDVQLVGKYQWFGQSNQALASKLTLTLPTGSKLNEDRALDPTTGDGRFKMGAALIHDYRFIPQSRWNVYAAYTALMPTSQVRRLPTSSDDSLSADKELLNKRLSHLVAAGTSVDYAIQKTGLTITAGYTFQFLSQTHYQGAAVDDLTIYRYGLLDDLEPSQVQHSLNFNVGFSTVAWYQQKEFFLPFEVNVVYSKPIAGRYAPTASVIAGEAVFFF